MARWMLGVPLAAAVALACGTPALSQPSKEKPSAPASAKPESKPAQPAGGPSDAEKAWMEAGQPGEHQARLKAFVGEWNAAIREYSSGAKPEESKGECRNSMAMGGRYLRIKVDAKMHGQEFDGAGTIGYNNQSGQYEYTWIDSMSTCIYWSTGTCDSDGKVFTFTGEMYDPAQKKKVKTREIWRLTAPDKYTIEAYMVGADGKDTKMMDIALSKSGEAKDKDNDHGKGKKDKDDDKGGKKKN